MLCLPACLPGDAKTASYRRKVRRAEACLDSPTLFESFLQCAFVIVRHTAWRHKLRSQARALVASPSLLLLSLAANVNGKMSFKAPNKHDDIELESPNHFYVKHVSDINSDDDARAYINEVKNAVSGGGGSFVAITDQATFDVAYSVALHAKRLSPENFRAFTGVLRTGLTRLLDAIASTELANAMARQSVSTRSVDAFKMYVFLLSVNTKLGLAAIKKESTHDVQVAGQSKRTKKQAFAKKKEVRGRGSARACCLSVSVCVPACVRVRACVRVFRDHDVGGGGFGLVVQQFVWRLAVRPLTARLTCSAPPSPAPPRRVHVCMRVCVCVCVCVRARAAAHRCWRWPRAWTRWCAPPSATSSASGRWACRKRTSSSSSPPRPCSPSRQRR